MVDKAKRYKELNKKYMMMKNRLAEAQKAARVKGKGKAIKAVEVDLMIRRNEIKVLRMKLDKEREKVKHLKEKLIAL